MKSKLYIGLFAFSVLFVACNKDDDNHNAGLNLVGEEGNPRFNLQFTNGENVDLDLYVTTPDGTTLSYLNPTGDGGTLDVDCMCESCPQGPNENIYWEDGSAPSGTYSYYVDYYGDCDGNGSSSDFTLRVIKNGEVLATKTGTLSGGQSQVWTHVQP